MHNQFTWITKTSLDLRFTKQNLSNEVFSLFAIFPLYLYHGRLRNHRLSLCDIITLYFILKALVWSPGEEAAKYKI